MSPEYYDHREAERLLDADALEEKARTLWERAGEGA